mgnify:CR=1 FL=1
MNRKKRALLLSAMCSLAILTGCNQTKSDDTIITKSGTTIERPVDVNLEEKVFEPGEHIIYFETTINKSLYSDSDNWGNGRLNIPETPEGYKLFDTVAIDGNKGTYSIVYIYVNEVTVKATPTYNNITGIIEYELPGQIVSDLQLIR